MVVLLRKYLVREVLDKEVALESGFVQTSKSGKEGDES